MSPSSSSPILPRPLPQTSLDDEAWWSALRRHELLVQECPQCGKLTFPPRPMCPSCRSLERGWRKAGGRGRVYSWVVVRRPSHPYFADKVPYVVVLVEMAEGFRVVGAIDAPPEGLRADLPVEAQFDDVSDELTLLRFRVVE